jgi:hypothetical protein
MESEAAVKLVASMKISFLGLILFPLMVLLAGGCGSVRRGEPITGKLPLHGHRVERGRLVFMQQCHECHPGGEGGLGPGINDKPLPAWLIRTQVRLGIGSMPPFDREQIPPEDLDDLVEYLAELRRYRGAGGGS